MEKLNVLLISYIFPPVGGTGGMRAASLARYFPSEGIRLDVLTTRNPATVGTDPTQLKDIPSSVTVHRTFTLDLPFKYKKAIKRFVMRGGSKPAASAPALSTEVARTAKKSQKPGLLKRLLDNILLPDPQVTWFPVLWHVAPRIIRKRRIDLVLITVPTFSNLLLVKSLRKRFPLLPIVVDFRDEWIATSFENVSFSFTDSARAQRIARKIEAAAVRNATAVVTVTESARLLIHSRYPDQLAAKFHLIPNGYDATKMTRLATPAQPRGDGKILLTHVGSIYASTSPTSLIEAIQRLPDEVRNRLRFKFVGHIEDPSFREALVRLGDGVELYGFLPQREALAAINDTDYLLLLNHDPLNVGNKFYDYVGGGKPILGAIHPDGETKRLLEVMHAGWWAGIEDVAGIQKLLTEAVNRGSALLREEFQPDQAVIAQYERAVLAKRYAVLLRSISSERDNSGADAQALLLQNG